MPCCLPCAQFDAVQFRPGFTPGFDFSPISVLDVCGNAATTNIKSVLFTTLRQQALPDGSGNPDLVCCQPSFADPQSACDYVNNNAMALIEAGHGNLQVGILEAECFSSNLTAPLRQVGGNYFYAAACLICIPAGIQFWIRNQSFGANVPTMFVSGCTGITPGRLHIDNPIIFLLAKAGRSNVQHGVSDATICSQTRQ